MKTQELEGALLDLYVARAEGLEFPEIHGEGEEAAVVYLHHETPGDDGMWRAFMPTIDWRDIGPIIDHCKIALVAYEDGNWEARNPATPAERVWQRGPTPQIAACRARVAQVLGEELPDEAA